MALQLTHEKTLLKLKKHPIVLICDEIESPANIGGIFRLSDALGIEAIYFCRNMPELKSTRLKRTSRNTHTFVPYLFFNTTEKAIKVVKKNNYLPIALELTENSISIQKFKKNENQKIALIIGNEKQGVSEKVLQQIETHLHIDMYGKNSSMNVVQAVSIACYSLTNF